jgi:hypothetical protein
MKVFRAWQELDDLRSTALEQTANAITRARNFVRERQQSLQGAVAEKQKSDRELEVAVKRLENASQKVEAARRRIGSRFVDGQFFDRSHNERHRLTPWLDDVAQRARDDVFIAAIMLHKAFVDAAAKPLRHNVGALMSVFGGGSFSNAEKEALLPDLWASFFLIVPVISTTFASVERMLGKLPPESLGWLLVDEAGQALPQAAVGAIMRTRRAVVVGDPIQIEPVVVLPDTLTDTICRRFGVDPDRFNAPAASIQTLADAATPFMAEFEGQYGSRTVGVPLLVHRRCAEPMFSISNAVAYQRLMVNAKQPGPSRIRDLLGPSRWINVEGAAEEKWCPQEGEIIVKLLREIAKAGIDNPNLYIVTPFVVVQDHLRKLVTRGSLLAQWTEKPWEWAYERIGTVHTVQGREADTVFFVLGAPAQTQTGARGWAGGKPNLLNVAVSRAKEALYVVGNRQLWREAGLFRELHARLPNAE